jgi:Na+/H+ antiporter NhaA
MTLFFLVVGLEAKRERDLGELREGRRLTVPVLAALAGMAASAAVYVALTAGAAGASTGGWGVAISTDTALALGALTIAAGDRADRLRAFMLTLLVVDDVAALLVISFVYPGRIHPALRGTALSAGVGFTVSLLIASRAFHGALLDQAKVGILATALLAPALAAAALSPLRQPDTAASMRRGSRLPATSPCSAR